MSNYMQVLLHATTHRSRFW